MNTSLQIIQKLLNPTNCNARNVELATDLQFMTFHTL